MQPIVSVIVPCYNQAQYLPDALNSVLAQTLTNWECVIVNDGSTDNTLEIANEWANKDERFVVVDKANGGVSDARNAGIKVSRGKYLLPLDADDIIRPRYLELATDYLDNHLNCKIVYCKAEFFGDKTGEWVLPVYSSDSELWNNSIFCTSIFRKSDYDKTLGYKSNMTYGNEDWDFWLTLLKNGGEVYKIQETMLMYRKHGYSHSTDLSDNLNKSLNQMVLNHIDLYSPFFYSLFLNKNMFEQLENLRHQNNDLLNSHSYKLGILLLTPLDCFKRMFRRIWRSIVAWF